MMLQVASVGNIDVVVGIISGWSIVRELFPQSRQPYRSRSHAGLVNGCLIIFSSNRIRIENLTRTKLARINTNFHFIAHT